MLWDCFPSERTWEVFKVERKIHGDNYSAILKKKKQKPFRLLEI